MARKYDFISELYNRTCKTVVANPASWEAFLRSACYNYRLRFDEQLLVHAQRPDATAVLQIDDWNQKFGRWVNRGAHGIAVFEDADQTPPAACPLLRYFRHASQPLFPQSSHLANAGRIHGRSDRHAGKHLRRVERQGNPCRCHRVGGKKRRRGQHPRLSPRSDLQRERQLPGRRIRRRNHPHFQNSGEKQRRLYDDDPPGH